MEENALVPAVDRTARILMAFKSGKEELGVSELSKALGINKSTVHKIAATLCHHGFLYRNDDSKKYRLGYALFELGNIALGGMDLRLVARPYVHRLALATGQTVLLGVLDGDRIIIVDREESPEPMKITAPIGLRIPACAGAWGKVLLTPADLERLYASRGLPSFTKHSITDLRRFELEQLKAREQGYAFDIEEYIEGAWGVSVPILGHGEKIVAAVTVVGFAAKMSDDGMSLIIKEAMDVGGEISRRMGGHPRPQPAPSCQCEVAVLEEPRPSSTAALDD